MSSDMPLQDKEAFYEQLDLLDAPFEGDDDDLDDDFRRQSRLFFQQAKPSRPACKQSQAKSTTTSILKDISKPAPTSHKDSTTPAAVTTPTVIELTPFVSPEGNQINRQHIPTTTSFVQDTPHPPEISNLRRGSTHPPSILAGQSPSIISRTNSRKRPAKGKTAEVVPEEKQTLRGVRLFYIPSFRIGLRKQRMERAETYGAIVTEDILEATHVVVDENLKYNDIKTLIVPIIGKETPAITKDQWPLHCISEGRVLPVYPKYRIRGMPTGRPVPSVEQVEHPPSQISDKSLELKAPSKNRKRWDYVSQQTTSQSDTSPQPPLAKGEGLDAVSSERPTPHNLHEDGKVDSSSPDAAPDCESNSISRRLERTGSEFGDELSEAMLEVREHFKDLPRIGEEDAILNPGEEAGEREDEDDDTEDERIKKKARTVGSKATGKKNHLEDYFACNQGGTKDQASQQDNPNAPTIVVFKQMLAYYTQVNDHWRTIAYRRCISTLSNITDRKITTAEEARELPWFGDRLSAKLEEIVRTQTLARLTYALNDPMSRVLSLFLGIYGVGNLTADKWIAKGYRTLDDLLQRADLNYSQRIGIDHYDDLNSRIPRTEVTQLGDYVKREAAKIDQDVNLLIGGSYRRGADTSGDIDFIITKKGTTSSGDLVPFLAKLVGSMTRQGFLTAELASHSSSHRDNSGSKWHGCCVLPRILGFNDGQSYRPVWRRIDLLLVPETEYGAALIYFTGNDVFNRSIRLLASRKAMRLNQRGLYKDVPRDHGRLKIAEGELLEGRSEKRIFQLLGVKWREPERRWC